MVTLPSKSVLSEYWSSEVGHVLSKGAATAIVEE